MTPAGVPPDVNPGDRAVPGDAGCDDRFWFVNDRSTRHFGFSRVSVTAARACLNFGRGCGARIFQSFPANAAKCACHKHSPGAPSMGMLLAFLTVNYIGLSISDGSFQGVSSEIAMALLFVLTAVIQAFFLYHVFNTGRGFGWALLILGLPLIGCIVYYILEIFPDSSEHRNAKRVADHVAQAFMPSSELQRCLNAVEHCPSVSNKIIAAETLMRWGMYYRAVGMYQGALQGIYAADPQLLMGLARAHVNNQTYEQAREVLDRLNRIDARFRPEEARLLNARALDGLGRHQEALREYEALAQIYVGLEAKCRYGLLLQRLGLHRQANQIFADVLAYARRFNMRMDAEQVWIDTARRSLVEA
jgi:hypothetical protein